MYTVQQKPVNKIYLMLTSPSWKTMAEWSETNPKRLQL